MRDEKRMQDFAPLMGDEIQPLSKDELLALLEIERRKFDSCDDDRMCLIIKELIQLGVYPPEANPLDHLAKVKNYGVHWHEYAGTLNCPACGADWRNTKAGPPFKREIGVEVRGVYDGILYYQCPDCQYKMPRLGFEAEFKKLFGD